MRWIETIHVENPLVGKTWDIDLRAEGRPRHLILTGPNGSGKTTTLLQIVRGQQVALHRQPFGSFSGHSLNGVETAPAELSGVSGDPDLLSYFGAQRSLKPTWPQGPTRQQAYDPLSVTKSYNSAIVQLLVNMRTQQAYAREEGELDIANRLVLWFDEIQVFFRSLLGDGELEMSFNKKEFRFDLKFSDGRVRRLDELPAGFSSFLEIVSELLVRVDAVRTMTPELDHDVEGVVFIDEIDAHLHIELQERALPMLAGLFPGIQWVVTTHAPAVLGSLPHALVFDLGTGVGTPSEDFIGVRFGSIVTSHFGLPTDLDRDSTEKLQRLDALLSGALTAESRQELLALSALLSARSPALSMEVWARMRAQVVEGATAAR